MAKRQLPAQEYLAKILDYDPTTGFLYWKARGEELFRSHGDLSATVIARRWNGKCAGRRAFTANCHGYLLGKIGDVTFRAHRVIWKLVTGEEPDIIDHANGNRADNRFCNLASVTDAENSKNVGGNSRNTSGVTGVSWCRNTSRWCAKIKVAGQQIHLGYFDEMDDARRARAKAEREHGFSWRHGTGEVPYANHRKPHRLQGIREGAGSAAESYW